ncbi:hypothetical protein ES708_34520 [subsurface metagenome]
MSIAAKIVKKRGYDREYIRNHPEVNKRYYQNWRANHLEEARQQRLEHARNDREQHNAIRRAQVHYPDRQICEIEGCYELGERHHDDYSKPLEIRWLCKRHHKRLSRLYT